MRRIKLHAAAGDTGNPTRHAIVIEVEDDDTLDVISVINISRVYDDLFTYRVTVNEEHQFNVRHHRSKGRFDLASIGFDELKARYPRKETP